MCPTPREGYWLDGKRVPSVSTILNGLGWGGDALIQWAANLARDGKDWEAERNRAADIGTCAHHLIDCLLHKRELLPWTFPDDIVNEAMPCLDAFSDWAGRHEIKVLKSEVSLTSSAHRYGGTFDAVIRLDGVPTLLDFKSSNWVYPKNIVQVVAYLDLIAENFDQHLDTAIVLQVTRSGIFKTLTVEGEAITWGREAFYHLLQLHKLKYPLEKMTKQVNYPGTIGKSAELTIMGRKVA